ncbi:hypothetical protein JHK87_055333 [Glycine soja]|nr:hypothetical protein JHK87_055333 [Glycine soja]
MAFEAVLTEDIVKCHVRSHMSSLVGSINPESRKAKVVANIPFNISTNVIKLLLPMGDIFSEVVLLLQEETAVRLVVSSLRTPEYRPVNVFVNFYSDPEYKLKVPRSNFFPQPNVDAAVVSFKLKLPSEYPQVSSTKSFFSMVNSAFNEKRKMLRKSLQHICISLEIEEALTSIGLLATSRPEELTLDDFVKIRKHVNGLIKRGRLKHVQMLLKEEESGPWGRHIQAKLGSRLIELLIETAFVHSPANQSADTPPHIRPAFSHTFKTISKNPE